MGMCAAIGGGGSKLTGFGRLPLYRSFASDGSYVFADMEFGIEICSCSTGTCNGTSNGYCDELVRMMTADGAVQREMWRGGERGVKARPPAASRIRTDGA
jgi:hypothetical protein